MEFSRRPVNPGGENIRKKTGRKKRGDASCACTIDAIPLLLIWAKPNPWTEKQSAGAACRSENCERPGEGVGEELP